MTAYNFLQEKFNLKNLFSKSTKKLSVEDQIKHLKKFGMEAVNGKPRYIKYKEIQKLRGL